MGRRRQAREFALQALYLCESGMGVDEAVEAVLVRTDIDKTSLDFAKSLAAGTIEKKDELDRKIAKIAKNWSLERMATVDLNLLRLASFELLHCPETPPHVVIDEAVEIAKIYASADSSSFINGILDKLKKNGRKIRSAKPKTP